MVYMWCLPHFFLQFMSGMHMKMDVEMEPRLTTTPILTTSVSTLFSCSAVTTIYLLFVIVQIFRSKVRLTPGLCVQLLLLLIFSPILSNILPEVASVIIIVTVIYYLSQRLPAAYLSTEGKAVLITGCDQGIGHELAKKLDRMGLQVFAGCLFNDGPGEKLLKERCSHRLKTVQLDVRDMAQVENAAEYVADHLGPNKLWGIVNNAGICYIGNVETMTVEDMQKIMAVNYFGPVNICKAFLPLLRRSQGRLVNIASNAGLAPVKQMGVYCASKAALASMTEVWRYELQAWGINVSMIIPSGYKTGIMSYDHAQTAERWWNAASDAVREDYGKDCFYVKFKFSDRERMLSPDLTPITESMVDALLSKKPKPFYYRGMLSRSLPFLYMHLPTCIGDPIMKILADWFDFVPQALRRNAKRA